MSTDIAEHLAELASAEYKRSATGSQLAFEAIKDATDTQRMREDIAEAQALRAKAKANAAVVIATEHSISAHAVATGW